MTRRLLRRLVISSILARDTTNQSGWSGVPGRDRGGMDAGLAEATAMGISQTSFR
jgi:hypothetical protein